MATAKIVLSFNHVSRPAGTAQTALVQVQLADANGVVMQQSDIAVSADGVPASDYVVMTGQAGPNCTATAWGQDAAGNRTSGPLVSAPFTLDDDVQVLVVVGVAKG